MANLREFAVGLIGHAVKQAHPKAALVWDNGLGRFVSGLVDASGIPGEVTGDDVANGLLKAMGIKGNRPGAIHRPIKPVERDANGNPIIDVTGVRL